MTLGEHLLIAFPDLTIADVLRELLAASDGIEAFGLDEADTLDTVESIARHQLMLLTGQPSTALGSTSNITSAGDPSPESKPAERPTC